MTLNSLGLANSSAFVSSTSGKLSKLADVLLVYSSSNSVAGTSLVSSGFNPSAAATYFYYKPVGSGTGNWALYGDPNGASTDHGADTLPPGTGFIIRKQPTGTGATAFWQNGPNY